MLLLLEYLFFSQCLLAREFVSTTVHGRAVEKL